MILLALLVGGALLPAASAAQSTDPAMPAYQTPPPTSELYTNIGFNVAVFQENDPWNTGSLATALANAGATTTYFTRFDMGVADLSSFQKVIIPSVQTADFYAAFQANEAYFQAYVNNGGTLNIHAADIASNGWISNPMWDGVNYLGYNRGGSLGDSVTVLEATHTIFTTPNAVTESQLQDWGWTFHGYFSGTTGWTSVIATAPAGDPVWVEKAYGSGCVTITSMTVEWVGASQAFLDNNVASLGCAAQQPPVPELSTILLSSAGAAIVGLVLATRRRG